MEKKKKFVLAFSVLIIIAFVWVVMASFLDSSEGVRISAPASGTNYSGTIFFNVTYINGTDITDPINATFLYNLSGAWTFIGNTTPTGGCDLIAQTCNMTLNISGLIDGIYAINATLFNATDEVSVYNVSNFTTEIMFDTTPPIVFLANVSNPIAGHNYSGNDISLNVSVADAIIGVNTVFFNVTNITGGQAWSNHSFTAVNDSATNDYVTYLNTTGFEDGTYNITIWANDTLGNLNNSALLDNIKFDNTIPLNATINSPASFSNYSGSNLLLNVTVIDATSSIGTVFFNITNITGEQNATFTATREGTTDNFVTYTNTTGFSDGTYNVTVFANDTAGNLNSTSFVSDILFDNTNPTISFGTNTENDGVNISSDSIYVNVSFTEVNFANITFYLYNDTAIVNTTSYFTTTSYDINWTSQSDGNYTYEANITDAANTRTSTGVRMITLDNIAPALTFSCSPLTVTAGGTITCTCTATDATSKVDTVLFTENPSTADTGPYSTSCTAKDFAENSDTASIDYNVEIGGGTSGGGGGGGGGGSDTVTWKKTYEVNEVQFEDGFTKEIKEDERLSVPVEGEVHHVGVKSISGNSVTIEVSSHPQTVTLSVGESEKFEVNDDDFYDILVVLNGILNNKADITVTSIHEEIPLAPEDGEVEPSAEGDVPPPAEGGGEPGSSKVWIIVVVILVVLVVVVVSIIINKNKGK